MNRMKCEKIWEALDDFLDGSLTELEMEAVREHMAQCPKCREEMEQRKKLREELAHLDDDVYAPKDLLKGVMQRIRRERRPRRKTVYWIGGGLAAALCVCVGLAGMVGMMGMGGAKTSETVGAAWADMKAEVWEGAPTANESAMDVAYDAAPMEPMEEPASQPDMEQLDPNYSRTSQSDETAHGLKIIREASIELKTENYEADMETIRALTEEFGGFITSSSENGSQAYNERYGSTDRWCHLSIRVPSEQLDAFIERFDRIGIVIFTNIDETDVTAQYVDTDRKLAAYQKQYDRVLAMMDQAQSVEELLSIESELSRLELNIESAQGSLNAWDSRVNYSTVNVDVREVRRAQAVVENDSLGERMHAALEDSWYEFTEQAKDTLVALYAGIPYTVTWIIVLGIAGGVIVLIRRRIKRKKANR